jgi:hypothetical protein
LLLLLLLLLGVVAGVVLSLFLAYFRSAGAAGAAGAVSSTFSLVRGSSCTGIYSTVGSQNWYAAT